jgi:hypothetical protein
MSGWGAKISSCPARRKIPLGGLRVARVVRVKVESGPDPIATMTDLEKQVWEEFQDGQYQVQPLALVFDYLRVDRLHAVGRIEPVPEQRDHGLRPRLPA